MIVAVLAAMAWSPTRTPVERHVPVAVLPVLMRGRGSTIILTVLAMVIGTVLASRWRSCVSVGQHGVAGWQWPAPDSSGSAPIYTQLIFLISCALCALTIAVVCSVPAVPDLGWSQLNTKPISRRSGWRSAGLVIGRVPGGIYACRSQRVSPEGPGGRR